MSESPNEMEQALDAVKTLLEAVRQEIADGKRVTLKTMEDMVLDACRMLQDGDREQAKALRGDVEAIIATLDELENMLLRQLEGNDKA
ncbi:hypothetical protein [Magnetospira sp. QH-2]|uniref:hypothetical protein n=1 Tax=Magnetospira sp. (strain QH-2) TaxID=1288970 RepID=UPI0003E81B23|nr:hypothetical protein [Magnetospira sp. QH-2]CCQ74111.1 Protein of unknown function [Magnetospira sp. QH-2]